ncbi:HNH endonuclease, partial [Mesorhizobium sp. M00.F.Ca.ET.149.01.1.1]
MPSPAKPVNSFLHSVLTETFHYLLHFECFRSTVASCCLQKGKFDLNVPSSSWSTIRQQVLKRDGYRCVSCGIELKSASADIHHLLPRSMGGTDELSNLITLCDGCHARHHPN